MDETINVTNEEQVETESENQPSVEDEFKDAIEQQLDKIRRQSMLLGAQTFCHIVLKKIIDEESKPGKTSMNDYKRLIKDIKNFCQTGISRKVNADGETEPVEESETVQN